MNMNDNKEYLRQSESKSQSQSIDSKWKFIIPLILIGLCGCQTMQSKQPRTSSQPSRETSSQQDPQTSSQPSRETSSQQDPQTSSQEDPRSSFQQDPGTSSQPDPRTLVQQDPQNTPQGNPLVGTWQAVGVLENGIKFVAKINFQPNGTYQQEMTTAGGKNPYSSGIGMSYGSYKLTGQNSFVTSSEKTCTEEGTCVPYTQSVEFTIVNSNELSSGGTKFRRLSN
jgi:cytoskeletal protein RodZ